MGGFTGEREGRGVKEGQLIVGHLKGHIETYDNRSFQKYIHI